VANQSTFTIVIQGNSYLQWGEKEFPLFPAIVNQVRNFCSYNAGPTLTSSVLIEQSSAATVSRSALSADAQSCTTHLILTEIEKPVATIDEGSGKSTSHRDDNVSTTPHRAKKDKAEYVAAI
jgi:hypothetical protein